MPEMYELKSEEQSQQLQDLQLIEREELKDEEDLFEAIINKLTSHGINAGDVKKLQDAGIYTCNDLMMQTKKNLTGIKGLSEAKVHKICEAAEKIVNFGYITGSDALLRKQWHKVVGGGIEMPTITETFGEFRRGNLTPYCMAMKSMLAYDADGPSMMKPHGSSAIEIHDIGRSSSTFTSYEGEEGEEGDEVDQVVDQHMDEEGAEDDMGAEDMEGGEEDVGGGEEGVDLVPIFLRQEDGGLQFVGHVDRADCIDMEDFHDVSLHIDNIINGIGIELGEDFFHDFEIQLQEQDLEEGFFRVPYTFGDTLEAITRVVIRQNLF